ncbi:hypothetical protein GOODEAATRI_017050 [Goodea atripinnis]|uniref:Uncharacterized protein n=1 Tax=Goodea atripinnis TaxID=208336 RepID=A0ABV0NVA0_9TELE
MNISLSIEQLFPRFPSLPGSASDLGSSWPRIWTLEATVGKIRDSISRPPNTVTQLDDALFQLNKLRDELEKIDNDLPPPVRDPGLEYELDKLQVLLDSIHLIFKSKKDAIENYINPSNSGAHDIIKNAYYESRDADKKVNSTGNTAKEANDIREETKDIQNQVQPNNTRDLSKLKHNMSSQPDLTPVAKQVCGSVRSEPCTPRQCVGDSLCPPEGPACKNVTKCVGALPLSKRANDDVIDVKDRLSKLSVKITEATEMLQNTQETTDQVRQLAKDLSSKTKKARDMLEEDFKETHNVVKVLKDFLSDPSSNLTQVQEVSDWILNARLPISLSILKSKLEELKNVAANLPTTMNVLKEAKPQLDTARKLLQEAQDTRFKALGAKSNVSGLLEGLESGNDSLSDLEEKMQDSMDLIESLNNNLTQAKDLLRPAQNALEDTGALMTPMKAQLDGLKEQLEDAQEKGPYALNTADKAEEETAVTEADLKMLEVQLDRLKDKSDPGGTGETTPVADRLEKLQEKAGALANTTQKMTEALEGKADSLQKLQDEIFQKSVTLEGLDAKLKNILTVLRNRAEELRTCQG